MGESERSGDADGPVKVDAIRFHYLKSAFFRVIHVDGALGSVTARGYVSATLYSERKNIPRITEAPIMSDGTVGKDVITEIKEHVTREFETCLVFDIKTAREFAKWLSDRADELEVLLPALRAENDRRGLGGLAVRSFWISWRRQRFRSTLRRRADRVPYGGLVRSAERLAGYRRRHGGIFAARVY